MKKEKTIRTYQRRTKTGKVVTVKQHTAKYDATEALKEMAKRKGAGNELEKRKEASKDLINDPNSPWFEFENNFEEGWGGDSSVFCLANNAHHREVANLAANELAKKYEGTSFFQRKNWEGIAQKAYNKAAKKLYPKEKLWSGDNENNPAFWHEHLTAGGSKKNAIKRFWRKEWGSFKDFGKKPTM